MFVQILLFVIVLYLIVYSLNYSRNKKYKSITEKIGCSKGLPFVGAFFALFKLNELLYKWPTIIKHPESKSAFTWFGPTMPILYTYNQNFVRTILFSPYCNSKPFIYNLLETEIGQGIFTGGGSIWKRHRKLLNPSFNNRVLMKALPIFNEKSVLFVKDLEKVVGSGEVQLLPLIRKFTMKNSFASLLDFELNDSEEHLLLMDRFTKFLTIFFKRFTSTFGAVYPFYMFNKFYQTYEESKKYSLNFLNKLLHDKIKATNLNEKSTEDIKKSDKCFLRQAIDIHKNGDFSFSELLSEVVTILFASFDTSSITLHSVLFMLATHPEYQEKLFEEVINFFPDKEFNVMYEDIQHFTYMDRVINETMRVLQTAPIIGRLAKKDIQLSEDLILPSGTAIIIDLFRMHRDEDVWGANAKHFNPDNFLPENFEKEHLSSFLPFAKGSRNCIGWRFSMLFLKISLAKLVRNYRFETSFRYEDLYFLSEVVLNYKVSPSIDIFKR